MKRHFLLLWLLLFGSIGLAMAQSRQVQGVVKSAEGETLPGVTVLVEGTTNGASTGPNGEYTITPARGRRGRGQAAVQLRGLRVEGSDGGQPVHHQRGAGFGQQAAGRRGGDWLPGSAAPRRNRLGVVGGCAANQGHPRELGGGGPDRPPGGRAGHASAEGTPGNANVQVRVRGGGSITQDNSPLYVVDGMQIENALSVISPQDIASVDVLKDASATAIYGARGANGVVIITTKGGQRRP